MSVWNDLSRFVFGVECLACHRADKPLDPWLCKDCREELKALAKNPRQPNPDTLCLYTMTPLMKPLVYGLKYGGMPGLAGYLVSCALRENASREILWEWGNRLAFVPVPLHPARFRERGYNQAEKLAGALAVGLGGEIALALERRTFKISQTKLSRGSRENNVAGAFRYRKRFRWPENRTPVIVDDVFTTGSTTGSCLYALEREGLGNRAKVCTLLYEESATARVDFAADSAREWLV